MGSDYSRAYTMRVRKLLHSLPVVLSFLFLNLYFSAAKAEVQFEQPKGKLSYKLPIYNQLLLRTLYSEFRSGKNVNLAELLEGDGFAERMQQSDLVWSSVFESAYTNADARWFSKISDWKCTGILDHCDAHVESCQASCIRWLF